MRTKLSHVVQPGGLSKADHERIFELAGKGFRAGRIAVAIEKHPATVTWFMYRHGLAAPKYGRPSYVRGGRLVMPFTSDQDAFIQALRVEGHGPKRIAELATTRFGHKRSNRTIACRLVMLAAKDDAA